MAAVSASPPNGAWGRWWSFRGVIWVHSGIWGFTEGKIDNFLLSATSDFVPSFFVTSSFVTYKFRAIKGDSN